MAIKYQFKNPETGNVGEIDEARLDEAISSGMQPMQDLPFFNPETEKEGVVPAANASDAFRSGLLPVGTKAHKMATTGKLESFGRGMAQGVTLGLADELAAGVESTFTDKTYQQARDESRENFDAAEAANPITSMLGNLGGGVATALIPGTGLATAGKALSSLGMTGLASSKIAQAATMGAGMGALQGVGSSTHDLIEGDIGGVLGDAKTGALTGAVIGGGAQAATQAVSGAGRWLRGVLEKGFNPETTRARALGLRKADYKNLGVSGVDESIDELAQKGAFQTQSGGGDAREQLFANIDRIRNETGEEIRRKITGPSYAPVDTYKTLDGALRTKFDQIAGEATPGARAGVMQEAEALLNELDQTGGSISKLWELKKKAGNWVNDWHKAPNDQPAKMKLYQELYGETSGAIESAVNDVAIQTNDTTLTALNKTYNAAKNVQDTLRSQIEQDVLSGRVGGGLNVSDYLKGNVVGAAVQNLTDISGIGTVSGVASAIGASAARSPSGLLARAKIGEMAGLGMAGAREKAAATAAAVQQNLIPRTLDGVRDWVMKNAAMVPPPIMAQLKQIAQMPDAMAEMQVRAMMPMFDAMIAPSPYKSEFNGKITSPEDRVAARQVIMAQGLPPSVASYQISLLHKSGTLQPYHYAKPAADYGDELLSFNERLTARGY